jgi:tetratricopeptide (TPR) repeat protein
VGNCQRLLAHWFWTARRYPEAEQALRQALAAHQQLAKDSSDNPFYFGKLELEDWHDLGECLRITGRTREAESAYRNGLKQAHKLKARYPGTLGARQHLVRAQRDLGSLLYKGAQREEGKELLAQAAAAQREILKDYRDLPSYAEQAGLVELEQGQFLREDGRPQEAEKAFRQALNYCEEAVRNAPDVRQKRRYRELSAYCWERLARCWRDQDRFAEEEDARRRSLALHQQLFDEYPQESERRRDLANSLNNLAWLLAIRPDRQPRQVAEALEHAGKAVALQPGHHDWWHTLGVAHCRLGHWKEALACIEKSRQLENNPGSPGAWDRFFEAMAHGGLGDKENARRCYREGVRWMEKNAPKHRDLRRFRDEAAGMLGIRNGP